jgi:hypothetical protein
MSRLGRIQSGTVLAALLAIVMMAFLFAFSCNEGTIASDGDSRDGDSDTSDIDTSDPCTGAAVNCTPGTCEARAGRPFCICPDGYHAERYTCQPDATADGDVVDGDSSEDDAEPDGDATDGDSDIPAIPNCTTANNVFPCRMNLPFEDVDDAGLFRIGVYRNPVYGMDTWKSWIVADFTIFRTETDYPAGGGVFFINDQVIHRLCRWTRKV